MNWLCRRQLFLDTLRHLKDRHRGLLATGKSWQQNAAQQADRAIRDLTQRILTKQRKGSALNVLLAILIAGLAIVFLARQEFLQVCSYLCHILFEHSDTETLTVVHLWNHKLKNHIMMQHCHTPHRRIQNIVTTAWLVCSLAYLHVDTQISNFP